MECTECRNVVQYLTACTLSVKTLTSWRLHVRVGSVAFDARTCILANSKALVGSELVPKLLDGGVDLESTGSALRRQVGRH